MLAQQKSDATLAAVANAPPTIAPSAIGPRLQVGHLLQITQHDQLVLGGKDTLNRVSSMIIASSFESAERLGKGRVVVIDAGSRAGERCYTDRLVSEELAKLGLSAEDAEQLLRDEMTVVLPPPHLTEVTRFAAASRAEECALWLRRLRTSVTLLFPISVLFVSGMDNLVNANLTAMYDLDNLDDLTPVAPFPSSCLVASFLSDCRSLGKRHGFAVVNLTRAKGVGTALEVLAARDADDVIECEQPGLKPCLDSLDDTERNLAYSTLAAAEAATAATAVAAPPSHRSLVASLQAGHVPEAQLARMRASSQLGSYKRPRKT